MTSRFIEAAPIGKGSFGIVRRATDRLTGETVVVKRVPFSEGSPDRSSHESVLEEMRILRAVHHPNVCRVVEAWESPSCVCLALELCELGDLSRVLRFREAGLPAADVAVVAHSLLRALQYVHGRRILHRDIKPANVLITATAIKLADFGVARRLASTLALASTTVGSPCYMAPELHREEAYSSGADIWSLGCTLHECCSLRPAFSASNPVELARRIVEGRVSSRLPLQLSPRLRRLVELMLQRDPARRPDASELLRSNALRSLLPPHDQPPAFVRDLKPIVAAPPPQAPPPPASPTRPQRPAAVPRRSRDGASDELAVEDVEHDDVAATAINTIRHDRFLAAAAVAPSVCPQPADESPPPVAATLRSESRYEEADAEAAEEAADARAVAAAILKVQQPRQPGQQRRRQPFQQRAPPDEQIHDGEVGRRAFGREGRDLPAPVAWAAVEPGEWPGRALPAASVSVAPSPVSGHLRRRRRLRECCTCAADEETEESPSVANAPFALTSAAPPADEETQRAAPPAPMPACAAPAQSRIAVPSTRSAAAPYMPRTALQELPSSTLRLWRELQGDAAGDAAAAAAANASPPVPFLAAASPVASPMLSSASEPTSPCNAAERRERRRQRAAELQRVRAWLEQTRNRMRAAEQQQHHAPQAPLGGAALEAPLASWPDASRAMPRAAWDEIPAGVEGRRARARVLRSSVSAAAL